MVTIDRGRLISEKQNNKASAEGARLPKGAMLLRDIIKFTKPSLDAFRPFGPSAGLAKGQEVPPIALTLTFIRKQINKFGLFTNINHTLKAKSIRYAFT